MRTAAIGLAAMTIVGCSTSYRGPIGDHNTYGDDLALLRAHTDVIELSDVEGRSKVAVVPKYQGRVMTSTAAGNHSPGFGWINHALIASGKSLPHMNPFGGEDRFWMGPEGGQYAIFFAPDAPFNFDAWQTPAIIDSAPFQLTSHTATRAFFRAEGVLTNRHGFVFNFDIERTVRLIDTVRAGQILDVAIPPSLDMVAFETQNRLTNTGEAIWRPENGLLSIWILGMFKPSPETTVVIPIQGGHEDTNGPLVNDAYFGKVANNRLVVRNGVIYFRADGRQRGKIGIPPARTKQTVGSYNARDGVLTLVNLTFDPKAESYVNSMWELQDRPYGGDVVNAYNDGPLGDGQGQLGPFYEIESSSAALSLEPGEAVNHTHRTFHFTGQIADLDALAQATLGVSLADIESALPAIP